MLGKSGRRQMTGPDEGWVRWLVIWSGCLGACVHGKYFCDKWEVGYECEPGAGKPAYAKIAAAVVLSFSENAHPAFCRSLGKLRSPAPTPLRAFTAN
jgi:hypothetical protein